MATNRRCTLRESARQSRSGLAISRREILKSAAVLATGSVFTRSALLEQLSTQTIAASSIPTPEDIAQCATRATFGASWYNGTGSSLAFQIGRALRRGAADHYVRAYVVEHGRLPVGEHEVRVTYGGPGTDLQVGWTRGTHHLADRMTFPHTRR